MKPLVRLAFLTVPSTFCYIACSVIAGWLSSITWETVGKATINTVHFIAQIPGGHETIAKFANVIHISKQFYLILIEMSQR